MRINSIDEARGFSILLMFLANFLVLFTRDLPLIFSHEEAGLALPLDMVAPLFGFAIGISLPFTRRRLQAAKDFHGRVVRRIALLFLLGFLPAAAYLLYRGFGLGDAFFSAWSILQAWAVSYGVACLLIMLGFRKRFLAALGLAAVYQVVLSTSPALLEQALLHPEGGPLAAFLAWPFIFTVGTLWGELLMQAPRGEYSRITFEGGAALLAAGFLLHFGAVPMDRAAVSLSYVIAGAGTSLLLFGIFHTVSLPGKAIFRCPGSSPLLAWLLQGVVYIPYFLSGEPAWAWPPGGLAALAAAGGLFAVATFLVKAGLRLRV